MAKQPVTKTPNQPTVIQFPLERRKIAKKTTVAMMWWTLIFIILIVFSIILNPIYQFTLSRILITLLIVYIVIFLIEVWYQTEYFKRYFYNITNDFLVIKNGVIMPHEVMLPYEKLQDVYMDQDLFDRLFNLWDAHVSTATEMSGRSAHIDGVNRENAEKLRELVLNKIRKR